MDDDERSRIFKDPARRAEFWRKMEALIEEYPEIFSSFDDHLAGDMDERGILYNPETPKFVQGLAILCSVRNVDHWESMFVLDPPEQSHYFTFGMLNAAVEMQA